MHEPSVSEASPKAPEVRLPAVTLKPRRVIVTPQTSNIYFHSSQLRHSPGVDSYLICTDKSAKVRLTKMTSESRQTLSSEVLFGRGCSPGKGQVLTARRGEKGEGV